jgi:PBSX family phage terminase large subunit
VNLIPAQRRSLKQSDARINLWSGPVRDGKSYVSIFRWIDYIVGDAPPGELFMLAKTITTLKRNIIGPMQQFLGPAMHYSSAKNEINVFGRTIHTVGAATELAEGRLRGSTAAGAYCDEASLFPESVWTMLLSRLSVPGAKLFATTNPDSPGHWLKTNYMDRASELGHMKVFEWSLEEAVKSAENPNGFLEPDFVDAIKKEYTGLWRKRFIEGLWVLAEGAIYDMFNDDVHVIDEPPFKRPDYYIIGVDYGTGNPTCFEMIGVKRRHNKPPLCWAEHEYYHDSKASARQKTDAEYAIDLRQFIAKHTLRHGVIPVPVTSIYVDPSALSFKVALRRLGVGMVKDADNDVLNGIRTVASLLHQGRYLLCRECKEAIKEYGGYVWDPKKSKKGVDAPIKSHDHAKDAERYALHTHFGSGRMLWTPAAFRE